MPQSSSSRLPAASTRYFDPVTVPAAPKKVSFAIGQPLYRNAADPSHCGRVKEKEGRAHLASLSANAGHVRNAELIRRRSRRLFPNYGIDIESQPFRHAAAVRRIGLVKVLHLQLLYSFWRVAEAADDVVNQPLFRVGCHQ